MPEQIVVLVRVGAMCLWEDKKLYKKEQIYR